MIQKFEEKKNGEKTQFRIQFYTAKMNRLVEIKTAIKDRIKSHKISIEQRIILSNGSIMRFYELQPQLEPRSKITL